MYNELDLIPIISPSLASTEYGRDLKEQFDNINNNFEILSNRDFIKGDDGKSIDVRVIDLSLEESKVFLDKLKNAICDIKNPNTFPINIKEIGKDNKNQPIYEQVTIFDSFKNPGKLICIYKEDVLLEVMPYVFIDERFKHTYIDDLEQFNDKVDYSCILKLGPDGEFVSIQNFPTLYYDTEYSTFCWKINGIESGLVAKGPKGNDGKSSQLLTISINDDNGDVVEVDKLTGGSVYKIQKVLVSDFSTGEASFLDVDAYLNAGNIIQASSYKDEDNATAIVIDNNVKNAYWISKVTKGESDLTDGTTEYVYKVYLGDDNKISTNITLELLRDVLKEIDGNILRGLFVPALDKSGFHTIYDNNGDLHISLLKDLIGDEIVIKNAFFDYNLYVPSLYIGGKSVNDDINGINNTLTDIGSNLSDINSDITKINSDIKSLNDKVSQLDPSGDNTELLNRISALENKSNDLQSQLDTVSNRLDGVNNDITNITNNIDLSVLKGLNSASTCSDISKVPIDYNYLICGMSGNGSFKLVSIPTKMINIHIIIKNNSNNNINISIPNGDEYRNLTDDVLTIPAEGVGEISVVTINGVAYIRSV